MESVCICAHSESEHYKGVCLAVDANGKCLCMEFVGRFGMGTVPFEPGRSLAGLASLKQRKNLDGNQSESSSSSAQELGAGGSAVLLRKGTSMVRGPARPERKARP